MHPNLIMMQLVEILEHLVVTQGILHVFVVYKVIIVSLLLFFSHLI